MAHMVGLPSIPFLNIMYHPVNCAISVININYSCYNFRKDILKKWI